MISLNNMKNLYILIYGILLIAIYFALQGLISAQFAAPYHSLPLSYTASAEQTYQVSSASMDNNLKNESVARKSAFKKAEEKVKTFASTLHMKVKELTSYSEYISNSNSGYMQNTPGTPVEPNAKATPTPTMYFVPGEQILTVTLTYTLVLQ